MNIITLNNGVEIPQLGLGVYKSANGSDCENAVRWALECGYRHIDTAAYYKNEESVNKALASSGIKRSEIFVTTKCWNDNTRAGNAVGAFNESLSKLGLDYVDMYLIHWPATGFEKAYTDIAKLYEQGKIRAIGVSNFNIHHLEELSKVCDIVPTVNQIECHPYFANRDVVDYCFNKGIKVTAWAPLGGGKCNVLEDKLLEDLSFKYKKSVAQIVLRWHIQRGIIAIPKSIHQDRIKENFNVFDFELTEEDFNSICSLDKNTRFGADPETFTF